MIDDLYVKLKELKVNVREVDGHLDIQAAKGVLTNELLEEIRQHKKDLIALINTYKKKKTAYNPIPRATVQPAYPLSSSQRRLWLISQAEESSIAYHIPGVYWLEGRLDRAALDHAFKKMIHRHEILRTAFKTDETGEIRQFILSPEDREGAVTYYDLRNEEDPGAEVRLHIETSSAKPFDLASGALLRADLYQLADEKWALVYLMHHIVSDGWSMAILIREWLLFYNSYTHGTEPAIADLRIQYKDYAAWQQEQLNGTAFDHHKEYWLQQLQGELPVLDIPTDKPRPPIKTYNGGVIIRDIPPSLTTKLKAIAQEKGATLFMALLAVVDVLLNKYTGQKDILIGSPIDGREHPDLEDQIGFYINTLALRIRISPDKSYNDLLELVKQVTLGAYRHQAYPFDKLITELDWQRDRSRSALFDVLIDLHDNKMGLTGGFGDLKAKAYQKDGHSVSKFDLTFMFTESDKGLNLSLEYNSDLFLPETIQRMTGHFEILLRQITEFPELPVKELSCIDNKERTDLLEVFNTIPVNHAGYTSLVSLFEGQAARLPSRTAVEYGDTVLTYAALDESSGRLAHYLKEEFDVRPDDLIGVMLDRSDKMLIALLGILKSGAAYIPIDPEYPASRKEYIIKDTGIKALITQSEYLFDLDYYTGGIFAIDIQLETLAVTQDDPVVNSPDSLAYVIYTSGSTGVPKGCAITHGSVSNYIQWANNHYFRGKDKPNFGLFTSLSFDLTVTSIFCPLTSGGKLTVFGQQENISEILKKNFDGAAGINSIKLTPSHINIVRQLNIMSPKIMTAIVGGEEVTRDHVGILKQINPGMDIYNEYGPTEATVGCIVKLLQPDEPVLIGKPIANTEIYILDENRMLCPIGVLGEICIGGAGLARGYLNKDSLTATKFIDHPFRQNEKIYRTEDLARWLPDGNVEFFGRKDDQVKIRGYRIELGEIENALQSHPDIESAVVITRQGKNGVNELVAYFTGNEQLPASAIRAHIGRLLPAYMLPAYFVRLDDFPLTVNGKVDKRQLPDPVGIALSSGIKYTPPETKTEKKIVSIWERILDKKDIGIKDGFFDLGGDSIKIFAVLAEIKKELNLHITVTDIYKYNTIQRIALHVLPEIEARQQKVKETREAEEAQMRAMDNLKQRVLSSRDSLNNDNIEDVYPMSDIEKGMVFESLVNESLAVYHDQMVSRRTFRDFDIHRFRAAVALLIDRHSILRTGFNISDYETEVQIVYRNIDLPVSYKDVSGLPSPQQEKELREFIKLELARPFDLTAAPLWKMDLFNLGNDEIVLVFQCHHAIIDGWSDALLKTELNNLYVKLGEDPAYRPSPLKSNYKDFIIRHQLDKENNDIRAFWKEEIMDYTRLDLFTQEEEVVKAAFALKREDLEKLQNTAASLNTTVKVLSISAYLYMLKLLNYGSDIISGLVVNTRPDCEDSDKILGCFLNTIPFRMTLNGNDTGYDLVRKVHDKLIDLKDKEMLSIFEISRLTNLQQQSRNPFFDILFNYVDFHVFDSMKDDDASPGIENQSPVSGIMGNVRGNTFLDFTIDRTGGTYRVLLNINRKLKSGLSADGISKLYLGILNQISNLPGHLLRKFEYPYPEDRHRILNLFNKTRTPYPQDTNLTSLFDQQVEKTPGHIALIAGESVFTYRQLQEKSNQLAAFLNQNYDIAPNDLVGIKMARNEWMIVAMLGILKAGAAYVPIDPEYPAERIAYIIADSQCKLVLDDKTMTQFIREAGNYNSRNSHGPHGLESLSYVIYTSGSTGFPKGVMIGHRSAVAFIYWCKEEFRHADFDTVLAVTSICFDLSVFEIFYTLSVGKTLKVLPNALSIPQNLVTGEKILLNTVPSVVGVLLSTGVNLGPVKVLNMAGEPIPEKYIESLDCAAIEIRNLYGPTEDTTYSTVYRIKDASRVLIGRPITNTELYILNDSLDIQPIGVPGEICLAGAGLAHGYLNNPALTAECFVANPFSPGERMYKTGDLGKWLPDGNVEFLGRRDNQVKIRGYRIEVAEIEGVLNRHPEVNSAVVIARIHPSGEKELVAYLGTATELATGDLREYLRKTLPAYMIPDHFVRLQSLPLTPNGKVDRNRLPDTDDPQLSETGDELPPRNVTEARLLVIWQEILSKTKMDVKSNFFDLGGHSLKATRLASQIYREFEVKIALKDLLEKAVLEQQAELIRQAPRASFAPILPAPIQPDYPLSSSQRRIWILCQFEEGNIAYNMPGVYTFQGNLHRETLQNAFWELIHRYEILRTVFREDDKGQVRQFIYPAGRDFQLQHFDLRDHQDAGQRIRELVQQQYNLPFDLAAGPLLRAALFQVADDRWVFIYVMHHIISDGWSMPILIDELLLLYRMHANGGANPLPPLRIQYKDYAVWQQDQLKHDTIKENKQYWLNQFESQLPFLQLPADRPRPAVKSYNGERIYKTIGSEVNREIQKLSNRQGATLFMGLLAAVNTLLYRYTGEEDIIIGTPIAGREHIDLEDQIGFFVNTLALRTRFSGNNSFAEILTAVRQVTFQAYEHQQYPFDQLIDELDLPKDMGRHPLFDVMVVLQNTDTFKGVPRELGGIQISEYEGIQGLHSMFDWVFNFTESGNQLQVSIAYNTDIYERDTMQRVADHFEQLLEAIARNPDTPVNKLVFISEQQQHQLLKEFNDTDVYYPKDKTITALFEQQAETTPEKIALVFEETTLTYKELNEKSNRFGDYLRLNYSIKPDDLVGLKLDRSEWVVIAILGVLKAGGAYLPIDMDYPSERISGMISDSRCKTVIDADEVIRFQTAEKKYNSENYESVNSSRDLAYVMYTSGSTGRPKGVMVEHASVVRLIRPAGYVQLTGEKVLLSTGAISFDATTFEYWGTLLNGGRLILCRQEVLLDAGLLAQEIEKQKVNIMWFTAGWLHQLIDTRIDLFKGLTTILAGGDRLSPAHINTLRQHYPELNIVNGYGPTENTTFSLTYRIDSFLSDIPVGKPIDNSTAYILDDQGGLSPIGMTGEIYVGGAGLARGYLHHPSMTAERFLPHPFKKGERIYKTGDLGRWMPDGNIRFVGRKDDQVKIRGYRIEPGEIENLLQDHDDIDAAAVLVRSNAGGEKELVAYFVSRQSVSSPELRTYLSRMLPAYMVPATYMQLDELPLTPNGKVDRRSLPDPADMTRPTGFGYIPPRNETERELLQIWKDLLAKEPISITDNFFDLGGHSLKVTHLTGLIYKTFKVKLTIKQLFLAPTLEEQARLIRQSKTSYYADIPTLALQPYYPLSSSQRLFWISCQFEDGNSTYNMPRALWFEGDLDLPTLEYSFNVLIQRHESLRTVFRDGRQGEVMQYIYSPESIGFRIAYQDLRERKNPESMLGITIQTEFIKPFDLASGPLVRAGLYRLTDNRWVFTYVMHHIIGDGWSMRILSNELLALYNSQIKGEPNPLIPLRIQYKDYAAWQQGQLRDGSLMQHRSYWLQQLEGPLPVLDLPGSKERPVIKTYNGGMVHKVLDKKISRAFHTFIRANDCTLFMGLLAAVNVLLYKYTRQTDIILGTSIAGREHNDLEDQIGYYLNTLALRARFHSRHTGKELLDVVRNMTLDAYEYQAYPFEELINDLDIRRDISRNNLFDIFVVMRNTDFNNNNPNREGLSGILVSEYRETEQQGSKFDLTFAFFEDGDQLKLDLEYNSDIFEKAMVLQIADNLELLMGDMAQHPEKPILQLDSFHPEEGQTTFNSPVSKEF